MLRGTSKADVFWGRAGDDTISGGSGRDVLEGDEGADTLNGQAGENWLQGGEGPDTLFGNGGLDHMLAYNGSNGGSDYDRNSGFPKLHSPTHRVKSASGLAAPQPRIPGDRRATGPSTCTVDVIAIH